jgi:tRNA(Ile)-lysidine synthetase-like protein
MTTSSLVRLARSGNDEAQSIANDYEYPLAVPGEVAVREAGLMIRARLVDVEHDPSPGDLLDASRLGPMLTVRNWHPGDRCAAAEGGQPKKLKEYFQQRRIAREQRARWPVAFCNDQLVWAYGIAIAMPFAFQQNTKIAVRIDAVPLKGAGSETRRDGETEAGPTGGSTAAG